MGSEEQVAARWIHEAAIEDAELAETVLSLWAQAAAAAGEDAAAGETPWDVPSARQMLEEALAWVVALVAADRPDLGGLLVAVSATLADVREMAVEHRVRGYLQVHQAIGRLGAGGSPDQLAAMAAPELCRCGFDRAMVSRVEDGVATPIVVHSANGDDDVAHVVEAGTRHPTRLNHLAIESEMLRRKGPLLVTDPAGDPRVHRPLLEASGSRSFVAAPVISDGRVIAMLHADCYGQRRMVEEFDRDLIWMFAEGLGNAYDRALLRERVDSLRQEVRRSHASILAVVDEYYSAELELARIDRMQSSVARTAAAVFDTPTPELVTLLTRREMDVLRLMAIGDSNAAIAAKLVVSQDTVKTHVKHVLRKLGAKNRAEAVTRFAQLSEGNGEHDEDL